MQQLQRHLVILILQTISQGCAFLSVWRANFQPVRGAEKQAVKSARYRGSFMLALVRGEKPYALQRVTAA